MQKEIKENTYESINKKKLYFILVVSIGYAVGGIITVIDVIWTNIFYNLNIRLNDFILHLILFLIWGAIGGLVIGIATKKDKKLYMFLGGFGFAAGFIVASPFWFVLPTMGGTGVIIGIIEGILLGFHYKKAKYIGIMAACGAFGFGLGGIIEIMSFGMVFSNIGSDMVPVIRVILFMVTGLIGGASLGYGIYHIEKIASAGEAAHAD